MMKEDCSFRVESELELHYKVVEAIKRFYPHALLAICAGELQDTAAKRISMKKKGYMSGSPDILLLNKHETHRGFAIELKTPNGTGRLTDNQQVALSHYRHAGFLTMVSNDYDEILHAIFTYFRGVRLICQKCHRGYRNQLALDKHLCCSIRLPKDESSSSDD